MNSNTNSSPQPQRAAPPSLFNTGEVGNSVALNTLNSRKAHRSLLDLMYDGLYLIFLLRNGYRPESATEMREQVIGLLNQFERQARRLDFSAEDIHQAKYAYCALVDETMMTQRSPEFAEIQREWERAPLQLSMFGSQLAGQQFFDDLEALRAQGAERLPALEVYYYCLLLGFQGKYRLDAPEKINYLIARLGDEIRFLKGKKHEFAPFWAIPDQIRHAIRGEMPLALILTILALMAVIAFSGFNYLIRQDRIHATQPYQQLIQTPEQQASITIYLP
ncbi:MAG: type IVB secretion system protein IcmH/DotU [Pseudomonadota bacterium]|nr:type IVB secretion system protein IcmH/DotU [Pseudomonadota bacterium]